MAVTKVYPNEKVQDCVPGYVAVDPVDPDDAQWLHPRQGLVDLKRERDRQVITPNDADHDGLAAALRLGLTPADMSAEDWKIVLEKHRFSLADLSAAERELIARADKDGKGQVRRPPDSEAIHAAVWDAMEKGLVYLEGEIPGGGGAKVTFYRLTTKGRKLRSPTRNPKRTKVKPRRRRADARTRARNDRLRRILRGV